jgi:hypothetical protein
MFQLGRFVDVLQVQYLNLRGVELIQPEKQHLIGVSARLETTRQRIACMAVVAGFSEIDLPRVAASPATIM